MARSSISSWVKRLALCGLILILLAGCLGQPLGTRAEPVTLRFVYLENTADYVPLAEEFQRQNPNITIKLDPQKLNAKILDTLKKDEDIDAMRLPMLVLSAQTDLNFLPIDAFVSTAKNFPLADLYPGSLDAMKLDGKLVGLPAGINPFVMYYLPKKFAGAGVQPPSPDWTIADFQKTAAALHSRDKSLIGTDKFGYGFCSHPLSFDVVLFSYLMGGGLFDDMAVISKPTLNQPANVSALSWYLSLQKDFHLMPDKRILRDALGYIFTNDCWFWIDGLTSTFSLAGPAGAAPLPLPVAASGKRSTIAFQDGYYIDARSKHPEAAFQWIRFLMEHPAASAPLIPPLKSQIGSADYTARTSEAVMNVARSLSPDIIIFGIETTRSDRLAKSIDLYNRAAYSVFYEDADIKTALDAAQREAEAAFH